MSIDNTDRRTVLRGVTIVGAGAALSACGATTSGGGSAGGTGGGGTGDSAAPAGTELGKASDVPVGSGKIYPDQKVVVTQLTKGDFKAFSAVCTHQGCLVSSMSDTEIVCACHGSRFSTKDGSVLGGPAPAPLAPEKVTDEAGTLKLA